MVTAQSRQTPRRMRVEIPFNSHACCVFPNHYRRNGPMRKTQMLFLALALVCLLSFPAMAQESRGSILGTVTDAQKAVVPGAEIVVTNVGTNQSRTTISNDSGY